MDKLSSFLEKFKKFSRPDIVVREKTAEAIKKEIGREINEKDIRVKNGIIFLNIYNSSLKNEIFLKKNKILDIVRDLTSNKNIFDIK